MQRVNRATAVPTLPAAPAGGTPGFFTGGNPGAGQGATVPGYEWFNAVQEELIGLILRGGITPSAGDVAQVRQSLDRIYGGNLSVLSASATLSVGNAGTVYVNASGGPVVVTLPSVNAVAGLPLRFNIQKIDATANAITVQSAIGNTIDGLGSLLLTHPGQNISLLGDAGSTWAIIHGRRSATDRIGVSRFATVAETEAGTLPDVAVTPVGLAGLTATFARRGLTRFATAAETDAGTLSDVALTPAGLGIATRNYANPGYARLPGGLIMQWGVTNSGDVGTSFTATFPIAFPNAVLSLQGLPKGNGGNGAFALYDGIATLTGCTFTMGEWAALVQNASVAYLAIGR